jgi:hypothetical protein
MGRSTCKRKEKREMKRFLLFILAISFVLYSCDRGSRVIIKNNTDYRIRIDFMSKLLKYFNEPKDFKFKKYQWYDIKGHEANLHVLAESPIIEPHGSEDFIFLLGSRLQIEHKVFIDIREKDPSALIDQFFDEINVFIVKNDENILLYDKEDFVEQKGIKVVREPYELYFIIELNNCGQEPVSE